MNNQNNEPVKVSTRWMCGTKQHVLGLVFRENGKGHGLILFRHAIPEQGDITQAVQAGMFFGELHVTCDLCKAHGVADPVRTWFPGEYELNRLLRRARAR